MALREWPAVAWLADASDFHSINRHSYGNHNSRSLCTCIVKLTCTWIYVHIQTLTMHCNKSAQRFFHFFSWGRNQNVPAKNCHLCADEYVRKFQNVLLFSHKSHKVLDKWCQSRRNFILVLFLAVN